MKKSFSVLIAILVIICMFLICYIDKMSSPFDSVYNFRKDMVDNHELIDIQEMDRWGRTY